jgi:hypothetical protein
MTDRSPADSRMVPHGALHAVSQQNKRLKARIAEKDTSYGKS